MGMAEVRQDRWGHQDHWGYRGRWGYQDRLGYRDHWGYRDRREPGRQERRIRRPRGQV